MFCYSYYQNIDCPDLPKPPRYAPASDDPIPKTDCNGEGIKNGISANELTNPDLSNKNYIFPDFKFSIPDKRTTSREFQFALKGRRDITSLSDEDNAILGKYQLNIDNLTLDELNRVEEIREANRPPTQKQVADFLNISVSELTKPMIIQSGIYQDWKSTKGRIFSRTLRRGGN